VAGVIPEMIVFCLIGNFFFGCPVTKLFVAGITPRLPKHGFNGNVRILIAHKESPQIVFHFQEVGDIMQDLILGAKNYFSIDP
jgi:hypothetical protein